MDFKIHRIKRIEGSKILAFIDILIDNDLVLKGFKIMNGSQGIFLCNPAEKGGRDKDKYFDTVFFLNAMTKQVLEDMVLKEWNKLKKEEEPDEYPAS